MKPFSAVLLAGGRSTRMGRDKALLPLADGRLLWRRQLDVLERLGAAEIMFSGPRRAGWPEHLRVLEDRKPGLGPLAGLVAALEAISTERLLALAVDLPGMTAPYLRGLLARGHGVVPSVRGRLEPLAAVYPAGVLALARERLSSEDRSLHSFVRAAEAIGSLQIVEARREDEPRFVNWNRPGDFPADLAARSGWDQGEGRRKTKSMDGS